MDRKGAWIIASGLLVGGLLFGLSHLWAQRNGGPPPGPGMGEVGRYQVATVSSKAIIIIDTATGDLFKATPKDVKPFASRPKPMQRRFDDDDDEDGPRNKDGKTKKDEFGEDSPKDKRKPRKDDKEDGRKPTKTKKKINDDERYGANKKNE
jgi:hypothetical protein